MKEDATEIIEQLVDRNSVIKPYNPFGEKKKKEEPIKLCAISTLVATIIMVYLMLV